jgi:phage shock protein A
MIDRLSNLLFGDDTTHPLELDESEHRDKQVELDAKREQLAADRDRLKEKHENLKQQYMDAREAGDEDAAETALREAEAVDDRLETVEGKLDVVDQMSQTVSNFLNVYEMRELRDDRYWERLMELDREELVEMFSQEKLDIEEMTQRLDTAGVAARDVVESFSASTDRLHGGSQLRDEWDAEFERERTTEEESLDPEAVFDDLGGDLDDEDLSDLRVS